VSYSVTSLIRASRLPREMKGRPECKAVLLALSDRCNHDGLDAWPSVATIAAEVEISKRTVDKCLATLRDYGLIAEQIPPSQRKPRTWRLDLPALAALVGPQALATLTAKLKEQRGTQRAAYLVHLLEDALTGQRRAGDSQNQVSGSQVSQSGPHTIADDPIILNSPMNERTATSSRFSLLLTPAQLERVAHEPAADGNYSVIERVALAWLEKHPSASECELRAAVKDACASLHIDCGRHSDVEVAVVSKACASALVIFHRDRQARRDALEDLRRRFAR
jgi:hypothetical protein